ncbi:MAG: hypothetical protein AB1486_21595, partial [Planctomycetota bacterium]
MRDPYEIATWRYEMIAPFIDESVRPAERWQAYRERVVRSVEWPSGECKPIHRSTLWRWIKDFKRAGLEGLLPRARKDRGRARVDRSTWIDKAIHLLLERPRRSLTMLLAFLE